MIIFTAGYPFSGKSEFARELTEALIGKKVTHIDPQSLRPPEYDTMTADEQRQARFASWDVAQEMLVQNMALPNEVITIFDTCAAKATSLLQHFVTARVRKHTVMYCFVASTLEECRKRAGDKWPPADVIQGYARDFVDSIPQFKKASDKFFFIKNNADKIAIKAAAYRIAGVLTADEKDHVKVYKIVKPPPRLKGQPRPSPKPSHIPKTGFKPVQPVPKPPTPPVKKR